MSSALATALAMGFDEADATCVAKAYVYQGLKQATGVGQGSGPIAHLGWPTKRDDFPVTSNVARPIRSSMEGFPLLEKSNIGLYPVVDLVDWIARLLAIGVTTLQLRIKRPMSVDEEQQIPTIDDSIRILVVEDNDINAEIVMDMLRSQNIKCLRTVNGEQALIAVDKHDFDLILMDCQMPVMDGFTATQHIRNRTDKKADLPIIALTANAFTEDIKACISAGMDDHLSKPIRKFHLFTAIDKALNG